MGDILQFPIKENPMGEVIWGVDFAKAKDIRTREDAVDELARQLESMLGPDEALLVYALQGAPLTCQNCETLTVEMPADCPA